MGISPARMGLAVAGAVGAVAVAARLSPWPSVLVIRSIFDRGARRASAALDKHVPRGVHEVLDEVYAADDPDGRLDVFRPAGSDRGPLPTVVWVHGGAFVSGAKGDIANYLRVLAGQGFTVVGVDYSIAPEASYPTPVRQVDRALAHLVDHADRLGVDPRRIVLAGDSAGGQIAAQVAALVSDPAYASHVGIAPSIGRDQLVGVLLFCGAFDFDLAQGSSRHGSWLITTALWSYSGRRDYTADDAIMLASVAQHVSPGFPPAFVSAGNADPLLAHSRSLVAALERVGVEADTLFFPDDHEPRLAHEYQFDLDSPDGRHALDRAVLFLRHVTA